MAWAHWGLWPPSMMSQGSLRTRSKRPGQTTSRSPASTASSGICQPRLRRVSTVFSTVQAFCS